MPWTRLDDGWTEQSVLADLSFEARWHYLCMIQFCSRTKHFDGFIRAVDAMRCSDVTDPEKSLRELIDVGLIVADQRGYMVHRMEEDHAPPVWVRNRTESNKLAKRRQRSHEAGDHSLCLPERCGHAVDADEVASRQPDKSFGIDRADRHADNRADSQDRTGQDRLRTESFSNSKSSNLDSFEGGGTPELWSREQDEAWLGYRSPSEIAAIASPVAKPSSVRRS